ncbi:MAG: hypothetical protein R3Y18_01135 [Bacillota bacterium]
MKLLMIILNKTEVFEELLTEFQENDLHGTILQSSGMAHTLYEMGHGEDLFLKPLRLNHMKAHQESRVILMITKDDEMVQKAERILDEVVGGIDNPETAILFTVPLDYIAGLKL